MKKCITLFICGLGFTQLIFSDSVLTLSQTITKDLFNFKNSPEKKKISNDKLLSNDSRFKFLDFENQIFVNSDFSGMYLRGIDFKGGTFYKVNFSNADLTEAKFNGATFKECNLVEAILCENYKVKSNDHYELVREYSDLMDKKKKYRKLGLTNEVEKLDKQTDALNNLFDALKLNLSNKDLRGLNLIGINFQNADLTDAELQGVHFSTKFSIPNYIEPKDLFEKWDKANKNNSPKKEFYNKLVNARFNLFTYIPYERLEQVNWKGLNLRNANIASTDLHNLNFSEANLEQCNLQGSDLTNSILIEVNLKNTNLNDAILRGTRFSKDFKVPNYTDLKDLFEEWDKANKENLPEKEFYTLLINCGVNIFKEVANERLKQVLWDGLDLRNANLSYADLRGVLLQRVNLQNAKLLHAKLQDAHLQRANLNFSDCFGADLSNTNLMSVTLIGSTLNSVNLIESTLKSTDFTFAGLSMMRLSNQTRLRYNVNDPTYLKFYHSCEDIEAKSLLKVILESRGVLLESK